MSSPDFGDVDFVRELRLRRWARENYVPADDRRSNWHPIVLQEMSAKDAETAKLQPRNLPYVPLAPSATHLLHAGHGCRPSGGMARSPEEVELYIPG